MNNQANQIETKNKPKKLLKFSPLKRNIARISMLVGFILSVAIFFMPVLRVEETGTIGDSEYTMVIAISPFQFLTGDTIVQPKIIGGTSAENEFLEMFLSEVDILEVAWEGMTEEERSLFYIYNGPLNFIIVLVPFLNMIVSFIFSMTSGFKTKLNRSSRDEENSRYFEKLYGILFYESDIIPSIILCLYTFTVTRFLSSSHYHSVQSVNIWLPIIVGMIAFAFSSGVVRDIIVFKEKKAIFSQKFRFKDTPIGLSANQTSSMIMLDTPDNS